MFFSNETREALWYGLCYHSLISSAKRMTWSHHSAYIHINTPQSRRWQIWQWGVVDSLVFVLEVAKHLGPPGGPKCGAGCLLVGNIQLPGLQELEEIHFHRNDYRSPGLVLSGSKS